jgi:AcrR family transcriptional regulator
MVDPARTPGNKKQGGTSRLRRRGPYKGDLREETILNTLERLLKKKPLRDIEVEELAHGSGISRPTFYFYFESKNAALASLTMRVREEMYAAADEPEEELADPLEDIRIRIASSARFWHEQGHVLRAAVQTWASEPETRRLYEEGISHFVEGLKRKIQRARRIGLAPEGSPSAEALAKALIWMNERCFYTNSLGSTQALADEELVDTLAVVWYRAIYCDEPTGPSSDGS